MERRLKGCWLPLGRAGAERRIGVVVAAGSVVEEKWVRAGLFKRVLGGEGSHGLKVLFLGILASLVKLQ